MKFFSYICNCVALDTGMCGGCFSTLRVALTTGNCDVWVDKCKLIVPEGSKERYAKASQWQEFLQIEETTGLDDITRDLSKGRKPAIFTIQGEQLVNREDLPAGIYIIDGVKTLLR